MFCCIFCLMGNCYSFHRVLGEKFLFFFIILSNFDDKNLTIYYFFPAE